MRSRLLWSTLYIVTSAIYIIAILFLIGTLVWWLSVDTSPEHQNVMAALVVTVSGWLVSRVSARRADPEKHSADKSQISDTRQRRNRQTMLDKVQATWIEAVLEKSLHTEVLIDLDLREQGEAVEAIYPREMQLHRPNQGNSRLPRGTKMMLDLARQDETALMLVVFNPVHSSTFVTSLN